MNAKTIKIWLKKLKFCFGIDKHLCVKRSGIRPAMVFKKHHKKQGPRIQVTAITALFTCLINKKNVTFVKANFNLLVLLSNCWASAEKKSTRNLREGVTASIKDQPILFIDTVWAQTVSSITIFSADKPSPSLSKCWEIEKN